MGYSPIEPFSLSQKVWSMFLRCTKYPVSFTISWYVRREYSLKNLSFLYTWVTRNLTVCAALL
jgi:hypothetical protein